jgi:RHS repeat-associated protein
LNRLTEATGPYGLRDYVYDPVGNRLSETDDTQTETYVYDLDSNQLAQRGAVQYQYDSAGNIIDNGQYTFLYNLAGRLGAVQAGGVPVAYYLYNGLGQRAVKTVGNTARVYIYDLNGLLLSEIDLARNTHVEYVYLDGRPLAQITPRPDLWAPELEHVLTDVQDPNQTATVSLDTTTQTLEFAFSGGGGQTYVNPPEWDETHFDNQRYLAIGDPQTGASSGYAVEYSLYLHEASIQVVLHLTPKAGGPERVFILETSTSGLPPIAYYHTDHLGTPKALTDQAQQLVWWGEYEPFGKVNITTEQVTNNLRFPGQYFDAETELHYNYFRDYDPRIGRYVESDPIGLDGGLNTYGYTQNNPINFSDPQGLKRVPCPEGMPKSAVCDDGKDNQNEPARCVTAECAAGLPPAKFDMRSIEEIDCSQCLFTCNLASLGFPSPLPTTVMKTIFFIEIGATTTGLCGLVCQEKCSKCN